MNNTETKPTHTPTPWTEQEIAWMLRHEVTDADFNFIVKCINAHEELLAKNVEQTFKLDAALQALKLIRSEVEAPNKSWKAVHVLADQAIAKAEGK